MSLLTSSILARREEKRKLQKLTEQTHSLIDQLTNAGYGYDGYRSHDDFYAFGLSLIHI